MTGFTEQSPLILGSRGSALALVQSRHIASLLHALGVATKLVVIKTQGDRIQDRPFRRMEGKGFFTKELEEALLEKRIDLAVHSLKDLPCESPAGLDVAAIPAREDPRDALIIHPSAFEPKAPCIPLKIGARVGTGSVRRQAQLKMAREDLTCMELRGNVPTRLGKVDGTTLDAAVLAWAGLRRLQSDLADWHAVPLDLPVWIGAPGQGALGLQTRASDTATRAWVEKLHNPQCAAEVTAERLVLARLGGGCQVPLAARAFWDGSQACARMHVFYGGCIDAAGMPAQRRQIEVSQPCQGADATSWDPSTLADLAWKALKLEPEAI